MVDSFLRVLAGIPGSFLKTCFRVATLQRTLLALASVLRNFTVGVISRRYQQTLILQNFKTCILNYKFKNDFVAYYAGYRDRRVLTLKCQPQKMIKNTQTIRLQRPTNCLSVFDHFVALALKGLRRSCLLLALLSLTFCIYLLIYFVYLFIYLFLYIYLFFIYVIYVFQLLQIMP